MDALKRFYELLRETYEPLFPISKRKRQEFLDRTRQKVDYYKPRIEERCKISLGGIKVKDNKEWLSDVLYGSASEKAVEDAWKRGEVPTEADYRSRFMIASGVEAIMIFPIWLYNTLKGADFRVDNSTIYVPFYYRNRFIYPDFKERAETLDYGVVHELSHILWGKISGNTEGYLGEGRKWFEGFATYCADNYFADFYPEGTRRFSDLELPRLYAVGKKRIKDLVTQQGKGIVLDIPKRWKEFCNNHS